MLRLRPYKLSDYKYILNWINDEIVFAQWCANKFTYPLTKEQMTNYYHNCEKRDDAWMMTALNEDGVPIGHLLMRSANYENETIHLSFVIVDSSIRGLGYGKEMISLVIKYAFDILKVKKVTLGVFDNNPSAHACYKSVGFIDENYHLSAFFYKNQKWGVHDMAICK